MKILVDTSVWSLALRAKKPHHVSEVQILARMIQGSMDIVLLGIILQELLQGIKQEAQFKKLLKAMDAFPLLEPTREDYVDAARLTNHCRSRGIQASTVDFLIATMAIRYNCQLLSCDRDFTYIAQYSDLKLITTVH